MMGDGVDTRRRIDRLVESVGRDRDQSNQLFQYVWTMVCVQRGLLRLVDKDPNEDGLLEVEEVRTGRIRTILRPRDLDAQTERLAVLALSQMIDLNRSVG